MKIFLIAALSCNLASGQHAVVKDSIPSLYILSVNPRTFHVADTSWTYSGICKPLKINKKARDLTPAISGADSHKYAFLKVHGNVRYDFLYRSYTDTPFYQRDFRQHSIKTNYNFLFRETIPVQVSLLHRNSNSPYFRDITDVTVRFSQYEYLRNLKENLIQQASARMQKEHQQRVELLEKTFKQKLDKVTGLEAWINSPARLQEIVEERERAAQAAVLQKQKNETDDLRDQLKSKMPQSPLLPGLPDKDAVKKAITNKLRNQLQKGEDSVLALIERKEQERKKQLTDSLQHLQSGFNIEEKKKELQKLKKELDTFKKQLNTAQKSLTDSLQRIKQEVAQIRDASGIKHFIQQKKLEAKQLPKGWAAWSAVKSVGIGRNWVDYSELTVKNISLSGVNVELNPGKIYIAAAAGRINYRFRDFVVKPGDGQSKQSLLLLRGGIGKKDGNNFILTWYDGKRSLLTPYNDTSSSNLRPERVIGVAAETKIRINDNQYIIAEFAKSSFHTTGTADQPGNALFEKVRNFRDRSNQAYSIKLNSYWPHAGTKLSGYYRKMGEHFQSFNLQPVNTVQEAYQLKWQQQLWKKRLLLDASVRKNDFSNPYLAQGVSSSNVFKSLQLSVRIPRYPFITIGYAPSSQLTVMDDQRIVENQYNTLSALMHYSYSAGNTGMLTNAAFLKFYNSSPDTGFIYYNAASFSLTQIIFAGIWQLQSGLAFTDQQQLRVMTIDQSATVRIKNWLSLSAGIKYNHVNNGQQLWGSNAGANIQIGKYGTIAMNYDKAYLPGTRRNLLPVHTGTLGYNRTF